MSALRQQADEYLAIRRCLGFKLVDHGRLLSQFAHYLDGIGSGVISTKQAVDWAQSTAHPSLFRQRQRLSVVRGFAQYMRTIDPDTEVPGKDLLPARQRRLVPYLYSPGEIRGLMVAARSLPYLSFLSATTYETLIGLLATTGMRVGEALGLDHCDVDLAARLLVVRCSKNGKSRQLPLHPTTVAALQDYVQRRDRLCSRPKSPSFFVTLRGNRPSPRAFLAAFTRLRRETGLDRRERYRPPRPHDLRHTFVLRALLNWYRAGADVQAQLPLLSTFLGHVDPKATYWYFEAAPELLALAAQRVEHAWENLP
jgi:integrase